MKFEFDINSDVSRKFFWIVLQIGLLLLTFVARIQTLSTGGSLMEMSLKSLQVPMGCFGGKNLTKWIPLQVEVMMNWLLHISICLRFCSCSCCIPKQRNATWMHRGLGSTLCMSLTPKNHLQGRFFLPHLVICYKPQPVQRPKDWQVCYRRSPCRKGFLGIGLPRSMRERKITGRGWGRRRVF